METMKRCPYCGQEILATAKKCRYCGEWLTDDTSTQNVQPAQQSQTAPQQPYSEQQAQQEAYQQPNDLQTTDGEFVALPQMSIIDATVTGFKKMFIFSGRARRSEYWWFILSAQILCLIMLSLNALLPQLSWISIIISILIGIAMISATLRRLHDTAQKGWFVVITGIPIVGQIFFLFLLRYLCRDSDQDENEYGPSPKYVWKSDNA